MNWDEMNNLYRGPSIDASYQVSVHLAKGFQRRRLKCEKLTDDGRQVMAKAHIAFGKGELITQNRNPIPHKWTKMIFFHIGQFPSKIGDTHLQ